MRRAAVGRRTSAHTAQFLPPHVLCCRWRKSPAELALMRRSAQLAAAAMTRCMQQSRPGVHEHQLASTFEYQ